MHFIYYGTIVSSQNALEAAWIYLFIYLLIYAIVVRTPNMKATFFNFFFKILSQWGWIADYRCNAVSRSLEVILLNWKFMPLISNSPLSSPPSPADHHSTFDFMNLTILDMMCKWNNALFVLVWFHLLWSLVLKLHFTKNGNFMFKVEFKSHSLQ